MGTMLVTGPVAVELQKPQEGPDFTEILEQTFDRRHFRQEADHFSALCGSIGADLRLVKELDPVIYLIDFDVVRNLIDLKPQDPEEQRQALRAFDNPDFHYALPIGAFSELLNWLRGFAPSYKNWNPELPVADGDRRDALKQLALAVNVWPDNPNERDLIRDIAVAAARLTDITRVLLTFLERKNFHAVFSDYDQSTRSTLQEILEKLQRRDPDESRDLKDLRDSQNLAVVCKRADIKSQRKANRTSSADGLESFVLLTQTSMLLDLVHKLDNQQDTLSIRTLSKLFKRPEASQLSEMKTFYPSGYPVMTPRRAFFVEELRRDGTFPKYTRTMLEDMKSIFGRLAHVLEEPDVPFHELSAWAQREKIDLLSTCIGQLNQYEDERFYRLLFVDRLLSSESAEPRTERFVTSGTGNSLADRPAGRALAETTVEFFYRSLVALNQRLNAISPTTYHIDEIPHSSGTFNKLTITSRHPEEVVMHGELYLDYVEGEKTPVAYSFRWQTIAQERRFFACLQAICLIAGDYGHEVLKPTLTVNPVTGDEIQPAEGVLYFANIGAFWAPLRETLMPLARGVKIADKLREAMADVAKIPAEEIEIQALRVQTVFGDFQLDLTKDESGVREVFVITNYNIGEQIAYICESTSLLGVVPAHLNEVLQQITSTFPRYSGSGEARGA